MPRHGLEFSGCHMWTMLAALVCAGNDEGTAIYDEGRLMDLPQPEAHALRLEETDSSGLFLVGPETSAALSYKRLNAIAGSSGPRGPMASPVPRPKGNSQLTQLMHTERGAILSAPLSSAEIAKAMAETASTVCTNTCASSYDGVCSDGATALECSNEEPFAVAGRGSCTAAEGSECELGTDCALRCARAPALPNPAP